ncbi:MAG: class I SAM-dependent methyltransferase, partial [Verrucomicrobiota bacterium]
MKHTVEQVEAHYDEYTPLYLKTTGPFIHGSYRFSGTEEEIADVIIAEAGIEDGMTLLDAGCGVCGPSVQICKKLDVRVEALTLSQVQVDIARERIAENKLENRVPVRKGDYHKLEDHFAAETFDRILFIESLEHSVDLEKALSSAHAVLKPGGSIYMRTHCAATEVHPEQQERLNAFIRLWVEDCGLGPHSIHDLVKACETVGLDIQTMKEPDFDIDDSGCLKFEKESGRKLLIDEIELDFAPIVYWILNCGKASP